MSCIQVWPLIKAVDHIRAHMQTQQKRTFQYCLSLSQGAVVQKSTAFLGLYSPREACYTDACGIIFQQL